MPGDRLPFAVRVGRKVDVFRLRRLFGEALYDLLFVGIVDICGFEVFVYIDAEALFGQVADVPAGRIDAVLSLQVF